MITPKEAVDIVKKELPGWSIQKYVEYRDYYIFQVFSDRVGEEQYDPFFSVNKETGAFSDYSIITDGDISELSDLFMVAHPI